MKSAARPRSILHVDLDPFFVSVERSQDPTLRGRPVIVGGDAGSRGMVAAASEEARAAGVRSGQSLAMARGRCPDGVFRPGDLETYARVSDDVTAILLAESRRVERPSADEAYVDMTPEAGRGPVAAAERIKDEIQRRLGLDASLGLASSRLAARVASRWARPRGLLIVLPGYEASFLDRHPVSALPDLPPHLESALGDAGFSTLGDLASADQVALTAVVGSVAAARLMQEARGEGEEPVAVAAPPSSIQEEATIRAKDSDRAALLGVLEGLASRAVHKLRPFELGAGALTVEVRRRDRSQRVTESFELGLADEQTGAECARRLAESLLDPASTVCGLHVRLSRLTRPSPQTPLFPEILAARLRSSVR